MKRAAITDEELIACWQEISTAVTRTNNVVNAMVERAGVPAQWFSVLNLLLAAEQHRLPMSVLAREVAMTSGGFSKLADRMAREGLIDRRGTPDDRRVINATLTDSGLRMARKAAALYRDALRKYVLEDLSADDVVGAGELLRRLNAGAAADTEVDFSAGERDPSLPDRRSEQRSAGA